MMMGFDLDFWHWWILGLFLIGIEVFISGTYFLWMGIAAFCVGLLGYIFPALDLPYEGLLFAGLSIGFALGWRAYSKRHPMKSDHPGLNRRAESYVGRSFILSDPIKDGQGREKLGDMTWRLEGPDLSAGTRVEVIDISSASLVVEAVSKTE